MFLQIIKQLNTAILPKKAHSTDIGFDIHCISLKKKLGNETYLYDTGLKIKPPKGYYVEIIPRSSISKSGFILANNTGIIDPDYTGNLYVALTKIDKTKPNLTLPFKLVQLVIRKQYSFPLKIVDKFKETKRGDGGFGSTN